MSANNFFISNERNNVDHYNYYYFDGVFTEDELTKINNLANSYPKYKGVVVGEDGSNNESNYRKGIRDGNNLELTHGLNGIRNTAKNKIQEIVGGRKDYKIDCLAADFSDWEISW